MKRVFFAILLFMSVPIAGVKAQFEYVKPHDLKEILTRKLVVIVEKPSLEVEEKLKRKGKNTADYKAALDKYNKNFKAAITKCWKISKGNIEYKTLDEFEHIADKKEYIVLFCRTAKQTELEHSYDEINGVLWWPDFKEVGRDKDFSNKMTLLGISLGDDLGGYLIYQMPMPDLFPTEADLDYGVGAASNYLVYRNTNHKVAPEEIDQKLLEENQLLLKHKTLLLRRDLLDKKLTDAAIKRIYSLPFLIAGRDTVDRAIETGDAKYAVVVVSPYDLNAIGNGAIQYIQYVYSPAECLILGSSGLLDMPTANDNSEALNQKPLITKSCLMDFCMYLKRK